MSGSAAVRRALARDLRERTAAIAEELTALIEQRIPPVRVEGIAPEWLRSSTRANVEVLNHLVERPADLTLVEPPIGALSVVRQLARQGVPFHDIMRAYRIGNARWLQICITRVGDLGDDPARVASICAELTALANDTLDRIGQGIAAAYDDELQHWQRQHESVRIDRILALLRGDAADPAGVEQVLSYRLTQQHLGVIAWIDSPQASEDQLIAAQRSITALARDIGCRAIPLLIARDSRTLWAWLPQPRSIPGVAAVQMMLADQPGLRLALGEPAGGPAGFATTHRQAADARDVGFLARGSTVFPYREVATLIFLAGDIDRARQWIAETLGPLAVDGRKEEELRRTLAAYSLANRSATATAEALHCHKNTVLYRIRSIERILGRPISHDRLSLDLALHACRWFGAAVLAGSAHQP